MPILDGDNQTFNTFRVESNTFLKDKVANVNRRIEIEVGDVKQPDLFLPQFKTKHWDNECNLSVRLLDDDFIGGIVRSLGNKVEWERSGRIARFYEKDDGFEDGGFEFEVEFAAKPASNILEFSIQTKGLDFFYQPELTEEEKQAGDVRPENIIGSYAVYHKTKRDNRAGEKEYRTGKAFHIYRPYVEDLNGVRVWCELNIDVQTGKMTVTIPQSFLDTAAYPIIVDPTFGYTTGGASGWTLSEASNEIIATRFTSPAHVGDIVTLHAYGEGSGGTSSPLSTAIYDDNAGSPDNLLAESSDTFSAIDTPVAWYTTTVAYSFALSTVYHLAIFQSSDTGVAFRFYYDSGDSGQQNTTLSATYPTWIDPFGTPSSTKSRKDSIYASYDAVFSATKSLQYAVTATPTALTKSLQYAVLTDTPITKSLAYEVTSAQSVTKSLQYSIVITPTALTKALQYEIAEKIYSREVQGSLPTGIVNLATVYSASEITDVDTDDNIFVDLDDNGIGYFLHQFRFYHVNNTDPITVKVRTKSLIAPSASTVFLQIYNHNTTTWETIDSDSASAANTEFELLGSKATSGNYYDGNNQIVARTYQQK